MCKKIETLFDGLATSAMRPIERKWSERLRASYVQNGHLSPRQYQVLRDIHHRRVTASTNFDRPRHSSVSHSRDDACVASMPRRSRR